MSEFPPADPQKLQDLYRKIAPIIESPDGTEAQLAVRNWNSSLFRDMRSEAEVLMLMHGQGVSDRYLYGLCSAVLSMREENGGILPELTGEQYELDRKVQDFHQAAQDKTAEAYFSNLEEVFEREFPLTVVLLAILDRDLRTRLQVPDIDIQEGFIPGWYKAMKTVTPLFFEKGERE